MKTKRALVVGVGGLRGAYDAGAVTELFDQLGREYFDSIYTVSAGTFISAYFSAGYPHVGESICWRSYVDGKKLVNYTNPLYGRNSLDLEYLAHLFHTPQKRLPIEELVNGPKVTYVVTNYNTAEAEYFSPKGEDVFDVMRASAALPLLHKGVKINGNWYLDGGLCDPLPFRKALGDGHDEVIVVYNKEPGFLVEERFEKTQGLIALSLPRQLKSKIFELKALYERIEEELSNESRVKVIRPSQTFPLKSITDTNKNRINEAIDLGHVDAKGFVEKNL